MDKLDKSRTLPALDGTQPEVGAYSALEEIDLTSATASYTAKR